VISEADKQILEWSERAVGESIAVLVAPASEKQGRGVGIYLLDVEPEPREHAAFRPRLQVWLKYLITCWADSMADSHLLLGLLLEAGMQNPDYELVAEPPSPALWQALGVAPQPSLTLRTRAWKELESKPVRMVRKVVLETVPWRPLQGVVFGPEQIPLCDADVELPALHLSTRTDRNGQFEFVNVPVSGGLRSLTVRARDQEMTVSVQDAAAASPIAIQFEMKE
jgi:hypothetical protein